MFALAGRAKETAELNNVLVAVRDGLGGALVLRGEAGIGKSALLNWAAWAASDMRVIRVAGAESEAGLGFAGLHQLLLPFLGELDRLPDPQRVALGSALGLIAGEPANQFLVGLAALTLITGAAASQPVLCVVDDAQWLDGGSAEVLGFVARRLLADRVGMLFAVEDEAGQLAAFSGLPELAVGGLSGEESRELLAASAAGSVHPMVAMRIVAETAGNPLALVEFGGELTAGELSGAVPLIGPLRSGRRLAELYLSRVRALPADAQTLLLVVAADQLGDPAKVWRAASQLGISAATAELPSVEQLVTWVPAARFRHSLMRSAVYHGAGPAARRRAHEALAAASDPRRDPDRRAWHLAHAATGPDEEVAVELERSAGRARARGGWASSAAFLERSAELTPDPGHRARRLVAAAEARLVAGHPRAARALLERAAPDLADPLAKAQASRLEGSILLTNGRVDAATSALLDAVRRAAPRDARLARDTLVEAFGAAQRGQPGSRTAEILRAARSLPAVTASEATAGDLLLDGFAAMAEHRYEAGFGLLRQAVDPATTGQSLPDGDPQHFAAFRLVAAELYDDVLWRDLAGRWVAQARDRGALSALVIGMLFLSASQLAEGRFAAAEATIAEARELASVVGEGTYASGLASAELQVLAWRGREDDARAVAGRLLATAGRDTGLRTNRAHRALTVLQLGLGNFQEALAHARAAAFGQPALLFESPPELMVEAAAGCGDQDAAAEALAATEPRWLACATPWSLGLLARCQALVAEDDDRAEAGYLLSIERLQQTRLAPELARSRLLYGEWLRRHRRRRGAREQLRAAHDTFSVLGIEAFAARARAELRAAGEHAFARQAGIPGALTAQEARIARLAAEGSSNQEIAARLFISASTVDYHLRKVFRKLDVTSRVQLGAALGDQDTVR